MKDASNIACWTKNLLNLEIKVSKQHVQHLHIEAWLDLPNIKLISRRIWWTSLSGNFFIDWKCLVWRIGSHPTSATGLLSDKWSMWIESQLQRVKELFFSSGRQWHITRSDHHEFNWQIKANIIEDDEFLNTGWKLHYIIAQVKYWGYWLYSNSHIWHLISFPNTNWRWLSRFLSKTSWTLCLMKSNMFWIEPTTPILLHFASIARENISPGTSKWAVRYASEYFLYLLHYLTAKKVVHNTSAILPKGSRIKYCKHNFWK